LLRLQVGEQDYPRVVIDFQPQISLSQVHKSTNMFYDISILAY